MLRFWMLPCFVAPCVLLGLAGCATAGKQAPVATAPLSTEDAALFTDGIDMLDKPQMLQDTWRDDWATQTQLMADHAQLIVRGVVTTVRSDLDPDQRMAIDIVLQVKERFVGVNPYPDLVLRSREGSEGFGSVQEHRERALRADMVAFVRYALENGKQVAHFALVKTSRPVLNAVDKRLGNKAHRVKIVEHTQE